MSVSQDWHEQQRLKGFSLEMFDQDMKLSYHFQDTSISPLDVYHVILPTIIPVAYIRITASNDTDPHDKILTLCEVETYSEASCEFDDCIFEGLERSSEVERYILFLNFKDIPDDFEARCAGLLLRSSVCADERDHENCQNEARKSWANRFYDFQYVSFVIRTGRYYCKNLSKLRLFRNCFTEELQNALRRCFTTSGGLTYDIACLRREYNRNNHCGNQAQENFYELITRLHDHNPHW